LVDRGRDPLDRGARVGVRLAHQLLRDGLDDAEDCLVRRHDRRADEADRLPLPLETVDGEADARREPLELAELETGPVLLDEVRLARASCRRR